MTPSRNTRSYTLRSVPSSPGRSFFIPVLWCPTFWCSHDQLFCALIFCLPFLFLCSDDQLFWPAGLLKRQNVEEAADWLDSVCSIFNYLNQFPRYSIARQNLKLSMNIADGRNFEKFSFFFPNFDNLLARREMMFVTKCFNLNLTRIKVSKQFYFNQQIEYKW